MTAASRTGHRVASREAWLQERTALLADEKELTRRNDELAKRRQELPWVRIDKQYRFDTERGSVTLADLFQGRSQLLIYHFMFGPEYTAGCPACSAIADGFSGSVIHLANHDVTLMAVSRAPLEKLSAYKRRMGWTFPWASSYRSDFNADLHVWFSEEQQRDGEIEYNYRREPPPEPQDGDRPESRRPSMPTRTTPEGPATFAEMTGTDEATYTRERPGMSALALDDGVVYHTYSAYARGLDALWGVYPWLDRAPKGRNELENVWMHRHDEYGAQPQAGSCCGDAKSQA